MGLFSVIPAWVIVVLVLSAIVMVLIKWSNSINVLYFIKKNFFYFFFIAFLIFIAISVIHIHRTNDVNLTTLKGVGEGTKIYFNWVVSSLKNIGKVTGYAIHQDWFTNSSSK